jgi:hypothetical protein
MKDQLPADIASLHTHEAFARFVGQMHKKREATIRDLHDKNSDQIMQLSGRISELQDLLDLAGWETLRKVYSNQL